jgi:hypothetical protein
MSEASHNELVTPPSSHLVSLALPPSYEVNEFGVVENPEETVIYDRDGYYHLRMETVITLSGEVIANALFIKDYGEGSCGYMGEFIFADLDQAKKFFILRSIDNFKRSDSIAPATHRKRAPKIIADLLRLISAPAKAGGDHDPLTTITLLDRKVYDLRAVGFDKKLLRKLNNKNRHRLDADSQHLIEQCCEHCFCKNKPCASVLSGGVCDSIDDLDTI